jgi:hypothetical protein
LPRNDTAPTGINNAIKLEDIALMWGKLGLHITSRRYRQIAKEGRVPEPIRGYVDALKCLTMVAVYYQGMAEGRGDSTHEEEKKLKTREERMIKEMERKVMEGSLIERGAVADEFVRRIHVLKSDMLALPKRLAKYPEAKEIAGKFVRHIMATYSRKTGVISD